jgi:hypothetical protein
VLVVKVETKEQADRLNESGETDPYLAANGHVMIAALRFPREAIDQKEWPAADFPHPPKAVSVERDYGIGDEIRYDSWSAWCAPECDHRELGPLEDW